MFQCQIASMGGQGWAQGSWMHLIRGTTGVGLSDGGGSYPGTENEIAVRKGGPLSSPVPRMWIGRMLWQTGASRKADTVVTGGPEGGTNQFAFKVASAHRILFDMV